MTRTVKVPAAAIPAIGLGTWELKGDTCRKMVDEALKAGYRHIDTAQAYENETEVGDALRLSQIPRADIFLTTKLWMDSYEEDVMRRSLEGSLARLQTDYVDLLLLHWPNNEVPLNGVMGRLCGFRTEGLARNIGVSNFTVELLEAALQHATEPLATNQVEYHPFLDQSPVRAACDRNGLALTAYSPLAQGRVFKDPVIGEIAEAHGKTTAQVTIRWLVQQPGVVAIPRSSSSEHVEANIDIEDFELTVEEMGRISALAEPDGRIIDPSWAPQWDQAA